MRLLILIFYIAGVILLLIDGPLFDRLILGGMCLFAGFMSSIIYYFGRQLQGADK
jgi:hypothetical protein